MYASSLPARRQTVTSSSIVSCTPCMALINNEDPRAWYFCTSCTFSGLSPSMDRNSILPLRYSFGNSCSTVFCARLPTARHDAHLRVPWKFATMIVSAGMQAGVARDCGPVCCAFGISADAEHDARMATTGRMMAKRSDVMGARGSVIGVLHVFSWCEYSGCRLL